MKWFMLFVTIILLMGFFVISSTVENAPKSSASPQVLSTTNTKPIPVDVLRPINEFRVSNELRPLEVSNELKSLADFRIADMIGNRYYSHTSPISGATYADIIDTYSSGSTVSCENLQLQNSEQITEAVTAWISSLSHKNCLLNPKLTKGIVSSSYYDSVESDNSQTATYIFVFIGSN